MHPFNTFNCSSRYHFTPTTVNDKCREIKKCFTSSFDVTFNLNKIKKQALCSAVLFFLAVPAYAQVDNAVSREFSDYRDTRQNNSHVYVGLRGGGANFEKACSSGSSKCNDDTLGYGFYGGYQFTSWFALEAALTDYGSISATYYGTNKVSVETWGSELSGVFSYDLFESLDAYLRVGASYQHAHKESIWPTEELVGDWGVVSAVGLDYRLSTSWSLRGEYQFIDDTGKNDLTHVDVHFVSLGLTYHFGQEKLFSAVAISAPLISEPIIAEPVIVTSVPVIAPVFVAKKTYFVTNALFSVNSSQFKTNPDLIDLIMKSLQSKEGNIIITGYSDNLGSVKYNQWISEKRAKVVANYIISEGISSSRLIVKSEGEFYPVASNKTATGRAENRRVELKFEKMMTEEVINNTSNNGGNRS
ncbi:outer membrane protein A [Psychromonas sp. CNPT3]|uniref:OmpA family protein n=1 Tax=Psychromonas sp. CNPT3 TaxID=314282 RepID=UPI00006E3C0F|nr:OmpA family protein [Psychromonas sp. CNPT3]AGH81350.1 outer membrane protein A [Psychromonas sp. CNPT3]